ncbi:DUF7059 domain-containing protein [Marisediminicola senii]|uniref:DUF7059 domain-containing protein n=1 Tax=Marisediminicola senii TaxID=2711233 RepID=UPI0013EE1A3B|nr:methyltransferase [Marisediminicola senii]
MPEQLPILAARLRTDLQNARFDVDAVDALWGQVAAAALHRGTRTPALRAVGGDEPLSTLATLFVLNTAVGEVELAAALPELGIDGAVALGLVEVAADGGIHPLLDLRPYGFVDSRGVGSWWIASDLGEVVTGRPLREDHVLGVGGASTTLSGLMLDSPVGSALDLGTGCGIQALHASRHADRVVATDISARAIELARLNAELNDVHTIEFRRGDLFEPVAGELFDHIVSNPPFVITPRTAGVPSYEYRDGGMAGDALVEAVIEGCAAHLAAGGVAQLLGNWEYRDGADALDRVGAWVDAAAAASASHAGLDAWVIEREVQDPAAYAETWIRDGGTTRGPAFEALVGAWLDDFEERRVTAVGFGFVTLRRPAAGAAAVMRRFERLPGALGHNALGLGGHIADSMGAATWLAIIDDEALGRTRLTVASDVTEGRHYWPGAEDPTVMTLRQGGGFGRSLDLDTALAAFVGACDGELSVEAIIGAIAQLLEVDDVALRSDLMPRVRELVLTGMLAR